MVRKTPSVIDQIRSLRTRLIPRKQVALYGQILLFGDSITEFAEKQESGFAFASAVRDDYIRRLDVVNRGLSGYNTELALRVLEHVIPPPAEARIHLMTIFLGANDSCFPLDIPGKNQCVPLPVFRKNLFKIIQNRLVVDHSPRIMLITPPPIDERTQGAVDISKGYPLRRSAENTKGYADTVREVGEELGLPVLDLWSRCMELAGWKPGQPLEGSQDLPPNPKFDELFVDGKWLSHKLLRCTRVANGLPCVIQALEETATPVTLTLSLHPVPLVAPAEVASTFLYLIRELTTWLGLHLSPAGYRVLYDEFCKVLAEKLPELLPENIDYRLPRWDEFPGDWTGPPQQR